MSSSFVIDLVKRAPFLKPEGVAALEQLNPRSPTELQVILMAFPNLGKAGVLDLPRLSDANLRLGGAELMSFATEAATMMAAGPPPFGLGASAPEGALWSYGSDVPPLASDAGVKTTTDSPARGGEIDLRACLPWPVRDQGSRGTCVSFAMTAIREALDCQTAKGIVDLSEQFLYWAIKTQTADPTPGQDGSYLSFGRDALATLGIPDEALCPYNRLPIQGNPGQAAPGFPSTLVSGAAAGRAYTASVYAQPAGGPGSAARVLNEMVTSGRPVAVSLPVFFDPLTAYNNWNTPLGVLYGGVINPVPTSSVRGGHAVCLTGFSPDAQEPAGGYFVIRNSWGKGWGTSLPDPAYAAREVGYGQVSATYVDRYLWEMCRL